MNLNSNLLAKNMAWNLLGQGAPVLLAVFAIPMLIAGMGTDRFGILTLAWMVIGYFSFFDLGLGRALTKLVADQLGAGRQQEIPDLVWTALALMLILGIVGSVLVSFGSLWLVRQVLNIPITLQDDTLSALYLLAASIPAVISTAGLRGILEAYQRFDLVNAVRIPMGLYTFGGPLLVLPFSQSLYWVVAVLVAGRVIFWVIHLLLCFHVVPILCHKIILRRAVIRPLFTFGSWMTVSNIVGPLMVYLDRFLIGSILSVAAVAYYATPYELATKLWIIPGALVGVLFPAFAASLVQDSERTALLFGRGINYVLLALFIPTLLMVTLAHEGLQIWLGIEFAQNSTSVLQWLVVGVFINSLAQVPFALVQAAGKPDWTAKLHCAELLLYLPVLWWLIERHGIEGAAIAWVMRVLVDTVLLFEMARQLLPASAPYLRRTGLSVGAALVVVVAGGMISALLMKCLLLILVAFVLSAWLIILAPEKGVPIRKRLKAILIFN